MSIATFEQRSRTPESAGKSLSTFAFAVRMAPSFILAGFCFIALIVVWRGPVEIGGDEGMEFSKELLAAHQPSALAAVWNDQQWFFSLLFGHIFRCVGFHPAIPRLFALLCSVLYCVNLRRLMPTGARTWAHICAIFIFLCYPYVIGLSMSGMLELPATVLALMGAQVLFYPAAARRGLRLFLGGMLVGAAIQIKLTAGVVFGAATLAFIVFQAAAYFKERKPNVWKTGCCCYLVWVAGLALTFSTLVWLSPSYSIDHLWSSHARAAAHIPVNHAAQYSFGWRQLFISAGTSIGFLLGAGWILKHRIPAGAWLLPVCYGICAAVIHLNHQPFWEYYHLHFAAAFAPIAGWFFAELLQFCFRSNIASVRLPVLSNKGMVATMGGAALFSLWCVTDAKRSNEELSYLIKSQPAERDPIVGLLRNVSPQVNWVFSRDNSTVAAAGLLMVPELTVLPKKRFWDGFTEVQVIDIVQARKPEVLILGRSFEEIDSRWQPLLQSSYVRAMESDVSIVYVAKSVKLPEVKSAREQLKNLGL